MSTVLELRAHTLLEFTLCRIVPFHWKVFYWKWGLYVNLQSVGAGDKIMMLADGNAQFAKAIGVDLDLTDKGLGTRSRRYAMLVDDQVRTQGLHGLHG